MEITPKSLIETVCLLVACLLLKACTSTQDPGDTNEETEAIVNEDQTVALALGSGEAESFTEGLLTINSQTLAAGGQTTIKVNLVNVAADNQLYATPTEIHFSSTCSAAGMAVLSTPVDTVEGLAISSYQANGCVGDDLITASVSGASASGLITVASDQAGSISALTPAVSALAILGFGTDLAPQSARISFQVTDAQGLPVSNKTVQFSLSNSAGGEQLTSTEEITDADGLVSTTLLAGRINNTVRILATLQETPALKTESDPISISIGPPDQDSFALSGDNLVPNAATLDGTEVNFTVILSDVFNNPVRNNTVVNFRAERGQIPSSCNTVDGSCSVTWRSANSAPDFISADNRVTVLAYTEGEESILSDPNVNGLYDDGEAFVSLGEVFLDVNNDGSYDESPGLHGYDSYIDFNSNGKYDSPDGQFFQGIRCSELAKAAGHCAQSVQVRESITLCIADNDVGGATGLYDDGFGTYTVIAQDIFGNTLPSGTEITLGGENVEFFGATLSHTVPTALSFSRPTEVEGSYCGDGYLDQFTAILEDPAENGSITLTINVLDGTSQSITLQLPATESEEEL